MRKWCEFAAQWGGICLPALEHLSDKRVRGNWHSAASETSLTLRRLGEESWAPREGCYCSAWLNKRRDEVGRLTDELGTSLVSMHWSSGELEPVKQTAPRCPPPSAVNNLWHTSDAKATNTVIYSHHTRLWSTRQCQNTENIFLLIYPEPITASTPWAPGLIM